MVPNLPDSYVQTPNKVKDYLQAMLNAEAPERFSQDFLGKLGFKSTNDRLWIGVLKDLGFLDLDGKPTQRYFSFLDRTQWKKVLAEAIRDGFSGLFAVNLQANSASREEVKNKLRTLYQGQKTDRVIDLISSTFEALVKEADFTELSIDSSENDNSNTQIDPNLDQNRKPSSVGEKSVQFGSLTYQINIVLPSTRDQSVYDAIFKSLREHLG